jgi:hypothetical protein
MDQTPINSGANLFPTSKAVHAARVLQSLKFRVDRFNLMVKRRVCGKSASVNRFSRPLEPGY